MATEFYSTKKEISEETQCLYCGKYHNGDMLYFCSDECKEKAISSDISTAKRLEYLQKLKELEDQYYEL